MKKQNIFWITASPAIGPDDEWNDEDDEIFNNIQGSPDLRDFPTPDTVNNMMKLGKGIVFVVWFPCQNLIVHQTLLEELVTTSMV